MRKLTREEYDNNHPDDLPPSSSFPRIYGVTFEQLQNGITREVLRKNEFLDKIKRITEDHIPLFSKDLYEYLEIIKGEYRDFFNDDDFNSKDSDIQNAIDNFRKASEEASKKRELAFIYDAGKLIAAMSEEHWNDHTIEQYENYEDAVIYFILENLSGDFEPLVDHLDGKIGDYLEGFVYSKNHDFFKILDELKTLYKHHYYRVRS